ncbi:MAG: sigma 54-interacting transcriptional regulator [Sandaracinaceae bacterium]
MAVSEDPAPATKISYVDGRPTTLTLRRCQLAVRRGDHLEEHIFDQDVVTGGATEDNDLVLPDETVSRSHCRIFREGDRYLVTDLDSTNGTFVDRVRVREAWLHEGCTVTLGQTDLKFQAVDETVSIVPSDRASYGEIIGGARAMREIYAILEKIAPTDSTVVLEGETGTGKEVVARTIHQQSRRLDGPFMVFDCGAVPENLIESELFGHEKGAFTGAISTRQGVFELAHGGTVFLDELGELSVELQPRLLRILEQRELKRVGGQRPIKVDVRVVAATNRNLQEEVRAGRFREDLYYRLSVVRVQLPPLRDRREDIETLARHFLEQGNFNRDRHGERKIRDISPAALVRLHGYGWPGNVRELHNVVERAVSFADGAWIDVADLPEHVARPHEPVGSAEEREQAALEGGSRPDHAATFKDAKEQWVASFESDYIAQLLKKNQGNISHAAREADIDRKYFRKLMKKYGIRADE